MEKEVKLTLVPKTSGLADEQNRQMEGMSICKQKIALFKYC